MTYHVSSGTGALSSALPHSIIGYIIALLAVHCHFAITAVRFMSINQVYLDDRTEKKQPEL